MNPAAYCAVINGNCAWARVGETPHAHVNSSQFSQRTPTTRREAFAGTVHQYCCFSAILSAARSLLFGRPNKKHEIQYVSHRTSELFLIISRNYETWMTATHIGRTWTMFITGPPTHSSGGRLVTLAGVCRRRLSGFVSLNGGPAGGFTRTGQVMTSCRLQSNHSSTAARRASRVTSR